MTDINWGILNPNNVSNVAAMAQQGFAAGRAERARAETGKAVQAVLADPANAGAAINALAKFDPDAAVQLAAFQQKQIAQQRDNQFREATGRYLQSGGALNALFPQAAGQQGVLGAAPPMGAPSLPPSSSPAMSSMTGGLVPPISAAPPPPADWKQRLGPDAVAALAPPSTSLENQPAPTSTFATARAQSQAAHDANYRGASGSSIQSIDPNTAIAPYASQGFGAESGVTGQAAPGAAPAGTPGDVAPAGTPGAEMPDAIRRAANSPDMGARNAAFMEMVKIDPMQAMKIDSEMRDAMLDRLEDADKAYRLAVARLPNVRDDASYQRVLNDVDAILKPMGMDIRESVPATYPGPEGTRQLLMQAMDAQQQLAAMDRRFSAEAVIADREADNARADRNTDSLIADRSERTGIARERVGISAAREQRISAGGGGRGGKGGGGKGAKVRPGEAVAKGPNGQRLVVRGGKWVPAQ